MTRTQESAFYPWVLIAVADHGGQTTKSEVIAYIGRHFSKWFTEDDKRYLRSGCVRWENTVCWARKHLITYGYLRRAAPHGVWQITPSGYRFIEDIVRVADQRLKEIHHENFETCS